MVVFQEHPFKSANPEGLLQVNCRVTLTPTQLPDIQPQLQQVNQPCARCNSLMSQDCIRTKVSLTWLKEDPISVEGMPFVYSIWPKLCL